MNIFDEINKMPTTLRVSEVAKLLRVDSKTVRNWILSGDLDGTKLPGSYRIERESVTDLVVRGQEGNFTRC